MSPAPLTGAYSLGGRFVSRTRYLPPPLPSGRVLVSQVSLVSIHLMSTAEKNNEKLFPLFRRNLTESNVNLYAATADKLATWASRDKAYYPFARPVVSVYMHVSTTLS